MACQPKLEVVSGWARLHGFAAPVGNLRLAMRAKVGGPEQRQLEPTPAVAEAAGLPQGRPSAGWLVPPFLALRKDVTGNFRHLPPLDVEAPAVAE